jgi:DNA-binding IclR family transcriptional regulator
MPWDSSRGDERTKQLILKTLTNHPQTAKEIAEKVGYNSSCVSRYLNQLLQNQIIRIPPEKRGYTWKYKKL